MKILIVSHFFQYPFRGGGSRRFQNLIKPLQERHEITYVAFVHSHEKDNEENLKAFRNEWPRVEILTVPYPEGQNFNRLNKIKWLLNPLPRPVAFSYEMKELIEKLIKTRTYDIVQFDYTQTGQYLPYSTPRPFCKEAFRRSKKGRSILVEHDITSIAQLRRARTVSGIKRKIFAYKTWLHLRRYEYNILRRFDKIVTMSEADKEILKRFIPGLDISVVPNGVDTSYYKWPEASVKPILTFMAGIRHSPNTDAAEYFIKNMWPLIKKGYPGVELYLLGSYPMEGKPDQDLSRKIKDPRIIWTGFMEDVRSHLAGSIFVVPLRIASGTRLKILEAMSMGCAVVSTSIGAEGILARHGEEILIADTPHDFARYTIGLLKNSERRKKIGQKARALVEKRYDWKGIIEIQEEVYKEIGSLR